MLKTIIIAGTLIVCSAALLVTANKLGEQFRARETIQADIAEFVVSESPYMKEREAIMAELKDAKSEVVKLRQDMEESLEITPSDVFKNTEIIIEKLDRVLLALDSD